MTHDHVTGPDLNAPGPGPRTIIAMAADMIFAAKIRGAAEAVGAAVTLARNPQQLIDLLAAAPATDRVTAIIDLDTRGMNIDRVITEMRHARNDARIIAYVSHVKTEAIHEARDAGADKVLARSAFTNQMGDILRDA